MLVWILIVKYQNLCKNSLFFLKLGLNKPAKL